MCNTTQLVVSMLFLLTLSTLVRSQVEVNYDKFEDKTTAETQKIIIEEHMSHLNVNGKLVQAHPLSPFFSFYMTFSVQATGKLTKANITTVTLTLNTSGRNYVFSGSDAKLLGVVDNDRVTFDPPIVSGGKDSVMASIGSTFINERSKFTMPLTTFRKMVEAKSVELRYGGYEFNLNGDRQKAMRELIEYIDKLT